MPGVDTTFSNWLSRLSRRVNRLDRDVRKARGRAEAERLNREFNTTAAELQMLRAHAEQHDLTRFEARLDNLSRTLKAIHDMIRKRTTPWWKTAAQKIIAALRVVVRGGGILAAIFGWVERLLPVPRLFGLLMSGDE